MGDNVATKTANMTEELLMGPGNPNHADEKAVRLQLIKQLQMQRQELEDELAELRCASRQLNDRLVKQAMQIDTEKAKCEDLDGLVKRARTILIVAHLKRNPTHKRKYLHPLSVATPECPVCKVLVEMERSSA